MKKIGIAVIVTSLLLTSVVFAAWDGQPYDPGETLDPECAPTTANCTVASSTLQAVYNATSGNAIVTTDNRDLTFTLADTATDSNLIFNLAGQGDFIIKDNGTAFVTFGDDGSTTFANNISVNGGTITGSGALTVDSAAASALNFGTGSSAKTITLGNTTGATALNLQAGSGGLNLTGNVSINSFSGLLKSTTGLVSVATAGLDYVSTTSTNSYSGVNTFTATTTLAGSIVLQTPTSTKTYISSDTNAARGAMLQKAKQDATASSTIYVGPGFYDTSNLLKTGVNYYFEPGAVVYFTGSGAAIFDDGANGTNGAATSTIGGHGQFIYAGNAGSNDHAPFSITNAASSVTVSAERIRSISAGSPNASAIVVGSGAQFTAHVTRDISSIEYDAVVTDGNVNLYADTIMGGEGGGTGSGIEVACGNLYVKARVFDANAEGALDMPGCGGTPARVTLEVALYPHGISNGSGGDDLKVLGGVMRGTYPLYHTGGGTTYVSGAQLIPDSTIAPITITGNGLSLNGITTASTTTYSIDGTGTVSCSACQLDKLINPAITLTGNIQVGSNLGVATTSPWRTLSVTGTVGFDGLTGSTGAGSLCLSSSKQVVYNSASDACLSSTRATKHDIAELEVAGLETLAGLEPVSFVYNEGDGRTRYGFIAEDTAEVDDHLATHDGEGQISGIDDRAILALVVRAVQEQEARWGETLESRGLTLNLDEVSTESPRNAREYILEKVKTGLKPVTDFVSARVTAVVGYFEKVHTRELCLQRADGTEKCLKAEDFDKLNQSVTPASVTPEVKSEPEPEPEPEVITKPEPAPELKSENPENSEQAEEIVVPETI
ncbi:MAG: tail fiber domain-containing protein [Patescibacteria group bacterium]